MIQVFYKTEKQDYISLKVEGHAPSTFGKPGENILCSAVSVLCQTLLLSLQESENLLLNRLEKGIVEFEIAKPCHRSNIEFELVLKGMLNLQKQYSELLIVKNIGA